MRPKPAYQGILFNVHVKVYVYGVKIKFVCQEKTMLTQTSAPGCFEKHQKSVLAMVTSNHLDEDFACAKRGFRL